MQESPCCTVVSVVPREMRRELSKKSVSRVKLNLWVPMYDELINIHEFLVVVVVF